MIASSNHVYTRAIQFYLDEKLDSITIGIELMTLSEERNWLNKVKRRQIITSHYTEQSKSILYFVFISRRLLFKFVNRNIKVDFKIDCQTSVFKVKMKGKKFF